MKLQLTQFETLMELARDRPLLRAADVRAAGVRAADFFPLNC